MATPTLTNDAGVTFTFGDGDCKTVITRLATMLDYDAMPVSTATSSLLYDLSGVTKVIEVSGELGNNGANKLSSGSAVTIDEQRKWLEQNMNGNQGVTIFTSNYGSSWDGASWISSRTLFSAISFSEETGNPNGLIFSLTLFVGDV